MKPITEENRRQLIALASIEISRWKLPADKQYIVDLMEIALASLTAEEVGYVAVGETSIPSVEYCASVVPGDSLYTIPPVPVIQLPEKYSDHEGFLTDTEQGYNDAIDEIKHINDLP